MCCLTCLEQSDKVVFQAQIEQTGLLKVSSNTYLEILANQEGLLAQRQEVIKCGVLI